MKHRPFPTAVWCLLVVPLLCLTGCQALIRPSKITRERSYQRIAAALPAGHDLALASCFVILSGDTELNARVTPPTHGRESHVYLTVPYERAFGTGLGVGLTHDGYVLTAAHVVGKNTYVLGWMEGQWTFAKCRLVRESRLDRFGAEFAILKVDRRLDAPARLSNTALSPNAPLYSVGRAGLPGGRLMMLGGRTRAVHALPGDPEVKLVATDIPVWLGDSGGPTFGADGRLVGVNTAYTWKMTGLSVRYDRFVCAPSWRLIERLIQEDRARTVALQ